MARKDYVAIAQVFRNQPTVRGDAAWARESLAFKLAEVFAADNAAFDRARFLAACGVAS